MREAGLSSDLEDSDSLLPGSGNGGTLSSVRLRGALEDFGRRGSGSSMLMDFFPMTPGMKDFLLSFLDMVTGDGLPASGRSSSPERLMRANILDCFLGTVLMSPVGAVVRISGAMVRWLAESPETGEEQGGKVAGWEATDLAGLEERARQREHS